MNETTIPALPVEGMREKVEALEQHLLSLPQAAMKDMHHFAKGLYAKELHIPAGTCIVGKVHLAEHLNFLMEGEIVVATDTGLKRLLAPCILTSPAGVKRVGFTVSNTVWVTVHAIETEPGEDPAGIEERLTVCTMKDFDERLVQELLGDKGENQL